jgi:acyl-CoA reductase-like NAD-dependent aldehyde dehydrogenase
MAEAKTTRTRTTKTTRTRTAPKSSQSLKSINPQTGEVRGEIPAIAPAEVADVVAQARKVAPEWAAISPEGRARIMREVRFRIYDLMDEIVDTVAEETGKPRAEALAHEVVPPMIMTAYLERLAPKVLRPKRVGPLIGPIMGISSRMEWRPFGVVGCITPWNFPIQNSFLAFASPLFAGNVVVIKPSEVTPASGELLRKILEPLPSGVATIIQGGGDVGAALVDAPCDKISFIGSPRTGRLICAAAAKHLTPVVMELGGKDAAVVTKDVDVDLATSGILWGAFANAGQICASIERAYVVDSVADEFQDQLLKKLETVKQGEDLGSLTFKPQLDIVSKQIDDAVKKGAHVLAGGSNTGKKNSNGSLWYSATVLTDVDEDMSVLHDETFGPVLTVIRVRDEDEAVRRANEDGVNLTASVWTKDKETRERISSQLRAGTVTANMHVEGAAAPWAAWGGVGDSGFGRVNGEAGLREFSVPVHVARASLPMKRAVWYPYDSASDGIFRGTAQFLGRRELGQKISALGGIVGSFLKAGKTRL